MAGKPMKLKNGLSFEYHQYGVLGPRFDDKINDVGVRAASWQFQVMFRSRAAGYLDKCWAWGKSEMIAKDKNTATHFLNSIGWLYSILDHLRGDHAWLVEVLQPQNSKRDVTAAKARVAPLVDKLEARGIRVRAHFNGNCLDVVKMEEEGDRFDAFLCLFDQQNHNLKNTMRPTGEMAE